jgi:hypothetical protein
MAFATATTAATTAAITSDHPVPSSSPSPSPSPSPSTPLDAGSLVATSNEALASLAAGLDPSGLDGEMAIALYAALCAGERRVVTLKALLSARVDDSGVFRDAGFSSARAYLADLEGTTDADAGRTLAVGHRLGSLPGLEGAARDGTLSGPKLTELSEVAAEHPEAEGELLEESDELSLAEVRQRARHVRTRHSDIDQTQKLAAIRRTRFFTHHHDRDGAFCFRGRDTPERGARLLAALEAEVGALREEEHRHTPEAEDGPTPPAALRQDACYGLLTGTGLIRAGAGLPESASQAADVGADPEADPDETIGTGTPTRGSRPPATVLVRIDLDLLLGATPHRGSVCELEGTPVPVPMARDLADDALLRLIFHRAGDIKAVDEDHQRHPAQRPRSSGPGVRGAGLHHGPGARDRPPRPLRRRRTHQSREPGEAVPSPPLPQDLRGLDPDQDQPRTGGGPHLGLHPHASLR